MARSFIEGVLAHAPAMMPLINPTPNCYHRVKPYTFAPSNVSWGVPGPLGDGAHQGDRRRPHPHRDARRLGGQQSLSARPPPCWPPASLGVEGKASLRDQSRDTTSEDNPALEKFPQTLDAALDALEADAESCQARSARSS